MLNHGSIFGVVSLGFVDGMDSKRELRYSGGDLSLFSNLRYFRFEQTNFVRLPFVNE